jgi:flavodoxin
MKTLILCHSYHHNNTQKVAAVIAKTLGAELKTPAEVTAQTLAAYDLVGFGSGIYFGKHHKTLLDLADSLPQSEGKVFIFSTSGQEGNVEKFHRKLKETLQAKGYTVVGEFNCAGYDTYGVLKLAGGIKKGRPNEEDLRAAEVFAQSLKEKT